MIKTIRDYFPRLAILVVLGIVIILFRASIVTFLIGPIASVIWLLWRVAASVDQNTYWLLLVALFFILPFSIIPSRMSHREKQVDPPYGKNQRSFDHWRSLIADAASDGTSSELIRRNLCSLLIDTIAHIEQDSPLAVQEALISKKIPLPPNVYLFIFTHQERQAVSRTNWIRRLTGKTPIDPHQAIADTLDWMEAYLENKHEE